MKPSSPHHRFSEESLSRFGERNFSPVPLFTEYIWEAHALLSAVETLISEIAETDAIAEIPEDGLPPVSH